MHYLRLLMVALVTFAAAPGHAVTVTGDDAPVAVAVHGLVKTQAWGAAIEDAPAQYDASIIFGRIGATADVPRVGHAEVMIEAASGTAQLLDGWVALRPFSGASVRIGRFKPAASLEFLGSAAALPFRRRADMLTLLPNRMQGVELGYTRPIGERAIDVRVGAFTAGYQGARVWIIGGAQVVLAEGLTLHGGFAVAANDRYVLEGVDAEPFTTNVLDAGLQLRRGDWWVLAESAFGFSGGKTVSVLRSMDDVMADHLDFRWSESPGGLWGAYSHVSWRGLRAGEATLGPSVGVDHVRMDDQNDEARRESQQHSTTLRAAFGAWWLGDAVRATLEYNREWRGMAADRHVVAAVLQASF